MYMKSILKTEQAREGSYSDLGKDKKAGKI